MDVLTYLEEYQDKYLSGEFIAKKLNMTRANVWKEINKLRSLDYEIIAVPSKGYKLISYRQNYSKYLLNRNLDNLEIEIHDTLSSTNDYAKKSTKINRLIITKEQTNGRGRMGKSFYSPKDKGLYFSYVIKPKIEVDNIPLITIASALAIQKALPIDSDVKWLNDILINNQKLAGILVEGDLELQTRTFNKIIIGVGINLFKNEPPKDLKNIITTLEDHTDIPLNKHQILIDFIHELNLRIQQIETTPEKLISDYKDQCITINKNIKHNGTLYRAIDINQFGNLIVEDENHKTHKIESGEIHD